MDKKQRISWGVSFSSLALVAGMVSYLGLANQDQANNPISTNKNNRQLQNGFFQQGGQDSVQNFDQSFGGNQSSPFDSNGGSNFDQNSGGSDGQSQFSNGGGFTRGGGHHHGFDTTTGGT